MLVTERQIIALPSIFRGAISMSYYRLYFMNTFNGHIERFEEFEADEDADGIARGLDQQGPLALELWCQHRKVARFEPLDLASQLLAKRSALRAAKAQVDAQADADGTESESRSA